MSLETTHVGSAHCLPDTVQRQAAALTSAAAHPGPLVPACCRGAVSESGAPLFTLEEVAQRNTPERWVQGRTPAAGPEACAFAAGRASIAAVGWCPAEPVQPQRQRWLLAALLASASPDGCLIRFPAFPSSPHQRLDCGGG